MRLNMTSKILESVQESNEDTKSLSYRALKEEATIKEGIKDCPRCGQSIIGYPAVSRFDNETEICSDCGTEEALENMMGYITNPITKERMSLEDFKKMKIQEKSTEEEIVEEVTIDTPTQEEFDKDDKKSKKDIEDRIGELRVAVQDEALSSDEKKEVEKELSELESNLNEGAFLDNREDLIKYFNEAWSEAKFLQAEMRFAKPSISKLRDSIPVICDNLDKLGELLKVVDSSESADVDKSVSEDTLKESVDWTSNPLWVKIINELDDNIYSMEKEEAVALLEQIKKDCDVFINTLNK